MADMTYSKTGLALTARFEGCKLESYQDVAGVYTIGYGHTLGVGPGQSCSQEQAEAWLVEDTQAAVNCVNQCVKVTLTQNEFDALVDFTFNLGCGALRNSTMLRLLNDGNPQQAALEFRKWSHAGGVEVAGLLARREAEESLFNDPGPA